MIKIADEIVIDAPVGEVFALYEDHETTHHWQPSLVRKHAHDGHLRKGARVTEVYNFVGRKVEIQGTIADYRKNELMVFTGAGPALKTIYYEYLFEPVDDGRATRVKVLAEFEPTELFGLARPLIERATRRNIRAALESAKDAIEMADQQAHLAKEVPVHDHHR